jgi:hypothetical protein
LPQFEKPPSCSHRAIFLGQRPHLLLLQFPHVPGAELYSSESMVWTR